MSKHRRVSQREIRSRSLRFENLEDRRLLAVVTVDTNLDVVDFTDGVTSLREAIFATNLVAGADEIQFDFGHDGPETIVLTLGELAITDSLTITGPGAELLAIDASGNDPTPDEDNGDGSRVFNIDGGSATVIDVELVGLTLTGGDISGSGGGILSRESLVITDTTISGNSAHDGGGVYSLSQGSSEITISTSIISENSSVGRGGGIAAFMLDESMVSIHSSTISGNTASLGGGIAAYMPNASMMEINSSEIFSNSSSSEGGGVYASASGTSMLTIHSSNVSSNSGSGGGGIWARMFGSSALTISSSTIAENSATGRSVGGGIYTLTNDASTITISSNNISRNTAEFGGLGGGISARSRDSSSLTIEDNRVTGNTATIGGGVWIQASDSSMQTFDSNEVSENSAFTGGGISASSLESSTLSISSSTISGNASGRGRGGGIEARSSGSSVLTIAESIISRNLTGGEGGGISAFTSETSTLTIDGVTVSENSSSSRGGGFYLLTGGLSELIVVSSSIIDNSASATISTSGGGIYAKTFDSSKLTISSSVVDGNKAISSRQDSFGGGIAANTNDDSTLEIHSTTISSNSADFGGGVWVTHKDSSIFSVLSSTISGNTADKQGGGIRIDTFPFPINMVTISYSTITNNSAKGFGGIPGIGGGLQVVAGMVNLNDSIVAGNQSRSGAVSDVVGNVNPTFSLIGHNRGTILAEASIGSPDANGNLIGGPVHGVIDPLLGDLADNGGPTQTHALLPGSPAINAGDLNAVAGAGGVPLFDQRGDDFDRIFSGRIDMGAFELQEFSDLNLLVDTLDDESDGDFSRFDLSLREAIELANLNPAADTIHFDPLLAGGTILLTMGELAITDSVDIIGLGAELLTIDASGNDPTPDENNGDGSRVLNIDDGDNENQSEVTIEGLRLTGGDVGFFDGGGGGIRSFEGLAINSTVITGNAAGGRGGGIYAFTFGFGKLAIDSSIISENYATRNRGGGVFIHSIDSSTVTINSSSVSNNTSGFQGGGGIFADTQDVSTLTISSSAISGNSNIPALRSVGNGGGVKVWVRDSSRVMIESTSISGNTGGNGGGVYARTFASGSITIADSAISGNFANRGGGVFGLAYYSGKLTISSTTVSGNTSKGDYSAGGIYLRANISGTATISSSTVSGNSATGGSSAGGIRARVRTNASSITISHSTVFDNSFSGSAGGRAGGLLVPELAVSLDHTIVAGNHDNSGVAPDIAGIVNSSFSLIGFGAEFLGPLADNGGPTQTHALQPGSPAIDAGDPTLIAGVDGTPKQDQRGFPYRRVFGARIDIGAFETQPLPGDFNGDGDSDGDDLAQWEADYGLNGDSDADGDGQTSGIDFLAWQITFSKPAEAPLPLVVASDSPTDARLEPRLVDAALAVGLNETEHFSLGRHLAGPQVAGRRDAVVVDEVFRRTDFFGPPASPANPPVASFSRHLFDSRQSTDVSEGMSDASLEAELAAESFALL